MASVNANKYATKKDLDVLKKELLTKLATKEEIKKLATKEELKVCGAFSDAAAGFQTRKT